MTLATPYDIPFALISNWCVNRLPRCRFHTEKQMTNPKAKDRPAIIPVIITNKIFSLGIVPPSKDAEIWERLENDVLYAKKSIPIGPEADMFVTLILSVCWVGSKSVPWKNRTVDVLVRLVWVIICRAVLPSRVNVNEAFISDGVDTPITVILVPEK